VRAPETGDDWVVLTDRVLPIDEASRWVTIPSCGAVVVFSGTVRDHAEGRPGVSALSYEAYAGEVEPRLGRIARECHQRWPGTGRVALWHRTGDLRVGDVSVVVAVSSAHRGPAFEAARWAIDTLKETVPIWKRESWEGGTDWGTGATAITEMGA
jgi:molybdopterin synthase catalytic subunit